MCRHWWHYNRALKHTVDIRVYCTDLCQNSNEDNRNNEWNFCLVILFCDFFLVSRERWDEFSSSTAKVHFVKTCAITWFHWGRVHKKTWMISTTSSTRKLMGTSFAWIFVLAASFHRRHEMWNINVLSQSCTVGDFTSRWEMICGSSPFL